MKNILITGGAGFIGSSLAKKLLANGCNVTVLDNLSPQIHGDNPKETSTLYRSIKDKVYFIKGSVTSRDNLMKAISGQDAIVHLAAETGTGQSMYEIQRYIDTNIGGTGIMLDILSNESHGIKKLIVASSRAIYGEGKYSCKEHGIVFPLERKEDDMAINDFDCKCPTCRDTIDLLPTNEDSKIHPSSIYGITKQTQEQTVLLVSKSLSIPAVVFRYQNVYGPGQVLSNPYTGILSIFSTQIKNNDDINIFEDGKESRDFVYIEDVINATILGLENDAANGAVFNVGMGQPISVSTVAETLKSTYNADINIETSGNYRIGDIRHNYADLSKIKTKLGYNPQWSFERGIKAFCDWVEQQEIQENTYNKSINEMKEKGIFK